MPPTAPSPSSFPTVTTGSDGPAVKTGPGGDFQYSWGWSGRAPGAKGGSYPDPAGHPRPLRPRFFRRRRDRKLEDVHRHAIRIAEEAQGLARRTHYLVDGAPAVVRPALKDLAARLDRCAVELRLKTDTTHLNAERGGA